MGILLIALFCIRPELLGNVKVAFDSSGDMDGWQSVQVKALISTELRLKVEDDDEKLINARVFRRFYLPELSGKRVFISVEAKALDIAIKTREARVIFDAFCKKDGIGRTTSCRSFPSGAFSWRRGSIVVDVPADGFVEISLGLRGATGTVCFKNLEINNCDITIDLSRVANMGFGDETAGDGKGGWSDQGPTNDASAFDYRAKEFLGVPFLIIDPEGNGGKAVMSFNSSLKFPQGLRHASVDVGKGGRFLYLLHSAAWGDKEWKGEIRLSGENGREQLIPVKYGQELRDHWNPHNAPNGKVAARWQNQGGSFSGVYLSKFAIDQFLGKIERISFTTESNKLVWMVVAATLSWNDYKLPGERKELYIMKENGKWKALKRTSTPQVVPDSALDLSFLNSGVIDRVIVNDKGRLALSGNPDKPVRFFCTSTVTLEPHRLNPAYLKRNDFNPKPAVDELVTEMRRAGCNMYKLCLPYSMLKVENGKAIINPEIMDFIDYLIYNCKRNGVYIMLNAALNNCPFSGVNPWIRQGIELGARQFSMFNMLFDDSEREKWRIGTHAFLTRVNPYTGLPLASDPVLAIITCYNEQEFAFIKGGPGQKKYSWDKGLNEWRTFIGDPDVPMFSAHDWAQRDEKGRRINDFITMKWREMYKWYKKQLSQMGYEGITTLWDMTKSMHYNNLRTELDLVTMHSYHNLATGADNSVRHNQSSDLAAGAAQARFIASTRIAGIPFFLNEYGTIFCNKHRYEESFSFAAFAALQGYDGIMRHNHTINSFNGDRIHSFAAYWDPIARSQQTTAALIFGRGDVREAPRGVRMVFSEEEIFRQYSYQSAMIGEQTRLALLVKYGLEKESGNKVPASDDLRIPLIAGARVVNREWESTVKEQAGQVFDFNGSLTLLKHAGILPKDNHSDRRHIAESSTGELYLDSSRSYMTIDTPRFQGMASLAGASADLQNCNIEVSVDSSLCVASIDGDSSVGDSRRLLLVFATNALNNGMVFEDESMAHSKGWGTNPTLVKVGHFRLTLHNSNADKLRVWPLEMNGARRAELKSVQRSADTLIVDVDTSDLPDGPALYFEIAEH
jgi:hypothetical protein